MAKFTWEATSRTGEKRKGVMEAETADIVEQRLRGDGLTIVQRVKKQALPDPDLDRLRRVAEGPADLHAPARDDDRRRPAARAVPRHPVEPDAEQGVRAHPRLGEEHRRAGRDVLRRAAQAPARVRRPLRQPRRRGRSRRHPRHDLESPRHLHREVGEAQGPDQERDVLPDRHSRRRDRRDRGDADQGHPDVREHVQGDGSRGAAGRDARRDRHLARLRQQAGTSSSARCSASSSALPRCGGPSAARRSSIACCSGSR